MNAPHLIGQLLREKRVARDLTVDGAAHEAGVSVRNLQRLEKGEFGQMRKLTRDRLATFYGLDPDDLRTPVEEALDEEEVRDQLREVLTRLKRIEDAIGVPAPAEEFEQAMGVDDQPHEPERSPRARGAHAKQSASKGAMRAQR